MATTQVLLREEVENLGNRGDLVKVKAGYARNYLLPRKLAVQATTSNMRQIERERQTLLQKEELERAAAQGRAGEMSALRLNFTRRVGEHGILYGSVTSMDIAEAMKESGYEVDRRRIVLSEPIKATGDFTVSVRLHREVTVEVPVIVLAEGATPDATGTATTQTATPTADVAPATEDAAR
jgi:large subunit ribosomal protein L9